METLSTVFDVAVIGAGVAGLICAQQLRQAGYSVVIIEKSRGAGGRLATRRLHDTRADHGARYLKAQGEMVEELIKIMCDRHLLQLWTNKLYQFGSEISDINENLYVPSAGMNSIGKFLANNLEIWFSRRALSINAQDSKTWHISLESTDENSHPQALIAKSIVVAIPAPQAVMLLATTPNLPSDFINTLKSVNYQPCITVMAGYAPTREEDLAKLNPPWKAMTFTDDLNLAWIGLDSSKRENPQQPVFVIQSSATFAEKYLESPDLPAIGQQLLERASAYLMPWLATPEWLQVHRWRYAFPHHSLGISCLTANISPPLVCAGDWCGENQIESALNSGVAAANSINNMLSNSVLIDFNSTLKSL